MNEYIDKIVKGDCSEILRTFPSNFVDLIVTSPPYAYNRKTTYGGIRVNEYVKWFLPISEQLKRVLATLKEKKAAEIRAELGL